MKLPLFCQIENAEGAFRKQGGDIELSWFFYLLVSFLSLSSSSSSPFQIGSILILFKIEH